MKIHVFENGPFAVNTYLIEGEQSAVIIDPGHDTSGLLAQLNTSGLTPSTVLLTHGHIDHIAGINDIRKKYPVSVYVHKDDVPLLEQAAVYARMFGLPVPEKVSADIFFTEGALSIEEFTIDILFTPGHSRGCVCFLIDTVLISGDTLFAGSVGRTDLDGGNFDDLMNSIRRKLFLLPPDTKVYPGHGSATSIGYEIQHNPYAR